MENAPTPKELAIEALQALKNSPMTSKEHLEFLIEQGIIDHSGRVLVGKLFSESENGEAATKAPIAPPSPNEEGK